ncbi:MAG: PD40 domain-containing protein [Anaerolineae bacterium]|jgi:TolB protein|nr:PD40 domain-containing protein [Anaerolineae bacterium]
MLLRAFRVTDRLGNAFLRVNAWAAMALAEQLAAFRHGLIGLFIAFWHLVTGFLGVGALIAQKTVGAARTTSRTAQQAVEVASARREATMAQRAVDADLKPTIAKDPLLTQNRNLTVFAVLLLLVLLTFVVLQVGSRDDKPIPAGGLWPEAQGTTPPTAIFPTPIPTATPVPDPLREGGSLVYTLRENGQEDLWVIGVGESTPLRLTNDPADDRDPAWSPDGTRVAFASHRDGNWELYILQVDTGAITRMTYTPGFEGAPTWSPDGAYLAYEGYTPESEDLDIYIISADPGRASSEGALRVTYAPGPDIEPAWSPDGRHVAYTGWRTGGNQDVYILSLDNPSENVAVNLSHTPDINENYPSWSPDGSTIAYSAIVNGVEGVYVKPVQQPDAEPILVGRGRMPAWAPNGSSLVYTLDYGGQTQIIAGTIGSFGAATDAVALSRPATDPDWTRTALPRPFIESGGVLANPDVSAPLYEESERRQANGLYGLAPLNNVTAPQPYLSDRVNDAFEALRLRVLEKAGYDVLGTLEDAFWPQDRPPEPGEPRQNWHYAGRAFSIDRDLVYAGFPPPVVVIREDVEVDTYWRVCVRVTDEAQDGVLGEPLRQMPWDLTARSSGDVVDYERGGTLMTEIPTGYYIDLTQLAADFGWQRVPAARTWQYNFGAIQFWEFHKTGGLSWNDAMLELYTSGELNDFLSEATHIPPPPPLPTESPTPEIYRSPTPIPPDMQ